MGFKLGEAWINTSNQTLNEFRSSSGFFFIFGLFRVVSDHATLLSNIFDVRCFMLNCCILQVQEGFTKLRGINESYFLSFCHLWSCLFWKLSYYQCNVNFVECLNVECFMFICCTPQVQKKCLPTFGGIVEFFKPKFEFLVLVVSRSFFDLLVFLNIVLVIPTS